jgi:hypothetical protein
VGDRHLKGKMRLADVAHDYDGAHEIKPLFSQAAAGQRRHLRRMRAMRRTGQSREPLRRLLRPM